MKVFIVFCGLLIINVGFLSYQGDMNRYVQCQEYLKAVAEECASGASLYYDEASYSEGKFQFRYEEGEKYIGYIISESSENRPLPDGSAISYQVSFQDDNLGYDGDSFDKFEGDKLETEDRKGIPTVTVSVTASTEDLFRLPFLEVTEIQRIARYELPQ